MIKHCCDKMTYYLNISKENDFASPDSIIIYHEVFDEYGLIIHDGGTSTIIIEHCPWCGKKLPKSKRDQWFDELESMGIESPFEQDLPIKYKTSAWWQG